MIVEEYSINNPLLAPTVEIIPNHRDPVLTHTLGNHLQEIQTSTTVLPMHSCKKNSRDTIGSCMVMIANNFFERSWFVILILILPPSSL